MGHFQACFKDKNDLYKNSSPVLRDCALPSEVPVNEELGTHNGN